MSANSSTESLFKRFYKILFFDEFLHEDLKFEESTKREQVLLLILGFLSLLLFQLSYIIEYLGKVKPVG